MAPRALTRWLSGFYYGLKLFPFRDEREERLSRGRTNAHLAQHLSEFDLIVLDLVTLKNRFCVVTQIDWSWV